MDKTNQTHVDVEQAAEIEGVSRRTVFNRISNGEYESALHTVHTEQGTTQKRYIRRDTLRNGSDSEGTGKVLSPPRNTVQSAVQNMENSLQKIADTVGSDETAEKVEYLADTIAEMNEIRRQENRRRTWRVAIVSLVCLALVTVAAVYCWQLAESMMQRPMF